MFQKAKNQNDDFESLPPEVQRIIKEWWGMLTKKPPQGQIVEFKLPNSIQSCSIERKIIITGD